MRTLKIYSHSNFQLYNTVLLTVDTILYIMSLGCIFNWKFVPFDPLQPMTSLLFKKQNRKYGCASLLVKCCYIFVSVIHKSIHTYALVVTFPHVFLVGCSKKTSKHGNQ